jgi:hypothetical protein
VIADRKATDRVVVPPNVAVLLESLALVGTPLTASFSDKVTVEREATLFGFAGVGFERGGPEIEIDVTIDGPPEAPTGFRADLKPLDLLVLPPALRPAALQAGALVPAGGGRVRVRGPIIVRIDGVAGGIASMRLLRPGSENAVVSLTLDPPTVLVGDSGIGFDFAGGLVLDDSTFDAPPAIQPPPLPAPPSNTVGWRGVAVRGARLHLPRSMPLVAGRPIDVAFEVGNPAGLWGHLRAKLAASGDAPPVEVLVEWEDPAAQSLADALPTLVEIVATVPVNGQTVGTGGTAVTLEGPQALTVRGRFARDLRVPAPTMVMTLSVEGGGPDGLLVLKASSGAGGKVFVAAAAFASAITTAASPSPSPSGDKSATTLALLLVAAGTLSDAIGDKSKLIVHRVEVEEELADTSGPLRFVVDYSVDVAVDPIHLPPLTLQTDLNGPLRIRYRHVRLELSPNATGLERFSLSFDDAEVGVEDSGKWIISGGPDDLFDVVGTRSGHGSTWFEIELRFALDLGPVKVSGATVRATFDGGAPTVTLRGLEAQLTLPGIIEGTGVSGLNGDGIDLALAATLIPLQIGALAFVSYEEANDFQKVLLGVGVDLPGPLPLANTGLGIFGLLGFFVVNGEPTPHGDNDDPIDHLLQWKPWKPDAFRPRRDELTFGIGAVVGTVPDLGFAFSSKAVLAVTVPDIAVRASLDATLLHERLRFASIQDEPQPTGFSLRGALAADTSGVTIALRAQFTLPRLLLIDIPFGAHFPTSGRDWFVHLGSDGVNQRGPGPIQAVVLPGLLDIGGWAYLMVHGDGLADLGGIAGFDLAGFSVGFGFGLKTTMGALFVRLDLSAYAVIGVGTNPFVLLGHGGLQGELHLGPVSLGVSADVDLQIGPREDDKWLQVEVCGEVDLFFFDLRGCVEIDVGSVHKEIPPPTEWPLRSVMLTDHRYGDAVAAATESGKAPKVWPDAIPLLQFSTGPANGLDPNSQFAPVLAGGGPGGWAGTIGGDGTYGSHDLRYTFRLVRLDLFEVDDGIETLVAEGLEAAWQLPKHGDPTNLLPGARELGLLTWEPHLWTRALPDGGKGLADDPLDPIAGACNPLPDAVPGWALGALASREGSDNSWTLPPEPGLELLLIRHRSEFDVVMTMGFRGRGPLDEMELFRLDVPGGMRLGSPVRFSERVDVAERAFAGGLALPFAPDAVREDDPLDSFFREAPLRVELQFGYSLLQPVLVLAMSAFSFDPGDLDVFGELEDGSRVAWRCTARIGTVAGETCVFSPPDPDQRYRSAVLEYDARIDVTILGVRGLIGTVYDDAERSKASGQEAAERLRDRQNDPPGTGRSLLKTGMRYKLVVGQQATGTRPGQAPETFPSPIDAFEQTFWFETPGVSAPSGDRPLRSLVFKQRDVFDARYLERYLLGYTPGDHTQAWFTSDPVAAHFDADHIAQLADRYGHDILLRCRRTDTPPGAPDDEPPEFSILVLLTAMSLAKEADRRLFLGDVAVALVGGLCELPRTGGASMGGIAPLAPAATYDLGVSFPRSNVGSGGPSLPGVVFTTSRWASGDALLKDLGFEQQLGRRARDLPVQPSGVFDARERVGDLLVERALAQLGVERWPAPADARTTALWTQGNDKWLVAGVLLDAPEPIHRESVAGAARLTLEALSCPGGVFLEPLRDQSGTRVLFRATSPFPPSGPLELTGAQQRLLADAPANAPVPFSLRADLGSAPRFEDDL